MQAAATGASSGFCHGGLGRIQTGALGIIAPDQIGGAGLLVHVAGHWCDHGSAAWPTRSPGSWPASGPAVAGLALVIRKYWDPIAAYVGGVFEGIRSAVQPAITSLSTALAPLAPIGQAVASVFGFIADGVAGWPGLGRTALLAPVTLSTEEFDSLSASGQSLGTGDRAC